MIREKKNEIVNLQGNVDSQWIHEAFENGYESSRMPFFQEENHHFNQISESP